MIQFFIITPVLNAAHYIDDTVLSVVTQTGDCTVRYHVQDGGSTDGTVEKLESWLRLMKAGSLPKHCNNVVFSYSSMPDQGIYDAVNKGFGDHEGEMANDVMMAWINAGDRLEQGALQTVASIRGLYPEISWISGGLAQINDQGSIVKYSPGGSSVSQRALATGLYEGRRLGFLQQEGVFWSYALWKSVGGKIAAGLKLAGDFQLWRQFAMHSPCFRVNSITGVFRRHADGLSRDFGAYNNEIDSLLAGDAGRVRDDTLQELIQLDQAKDRDGMMKAGFMGPVVLWNEEKSAWNVMTSVIDPHNVVTSQD